MMYNNFFGFVSEKNGFALLPFSNSATQHCTVHATPSKVRNIFINLSNNTTYAAKCASSFLDQNCLLCHLIMELRIMIDIEGPLS
jgi:hypothetical protein